MMHNPENDHFKTDRHGQSYAGDHMLVELWGAKNLTDPTYIGASIRRAAHAAGATILHDHYHHFGDGQGVSGVTVLAESHISIHTWPERGYAAIDIFMCGKCDPKDSMAVIEEAFTPDSIEINNIRRGLIRGKIRDEPQLICMDNCVNFE